MNAVLLIAHAPLAHALRECALHVFADAGDDIGAKSSTMAAQVDFIFQAVGIPVLAPATPYQLSGCAPGTRSAASRASWRAAWARSSGSRAGSQAAVRSSAMLP